MVEVETDVANYRVPRGRTLIIRGVAHPTGDVLPGWYADWDGGLAARVGDGHLVATADPVNVTVRPPEPRSVDDPTHAIVAECNKLREENKELKALAKEHDEARIELKRECESKDKALGKQTVELDRLRTMLDAAQKRLDENNAPASGEPEKAPAPPAAVAPPAPAPAPAPEKKTPANPNRTRSDRS